MADHDQAEAGRVLRANNRALLHALVGPPDERDTWWKQWRAAVVLDDVGPAAFQLLPLAARRFSASTGEDAARFVGIYRYAWTRNSLLVRSAVSVLRRLDGAGIEHVVLKGAALAETAYHDRGARPIGDVDVLVPVAERDRTVALLTSSGWEAESPVPTHTLKVHHSFNVSAGPLATVDLHWGILYLDNNPEADARAWARSVPIELGGTTTRALCPTDQLIHALVHADRTDLRWVVDVGMLIEGRELDWDLFCAEVEARRVIGAALRSFATARDLGGIDVGPDVIAQLAGAAQSSWDRLVNYTEQRPTQRKARATRAVDTFARRTRGLTPTARVRAVPPYLAQISGAAPLHRSLGALTIRLMHPSDREIVA